MKEEIKKDKEALEMQLPNIEPRVDANMIANIDTNSKNLNREIYVIMERMAIQAGELEKLRNEKFSRQLLGNIKNDALWESENVTLNLKDESLSPALNEDKDIMECEKMTLVLEEELQNPTLVEKNELAINKESSLKEKQVEKEHPELIVENVLVGIEDFHFPIDSLTFGMEEDRQVSFVKILSIARSQMRIDAEYGEMTLLVGREKMKFDLHQNTPLTDEEMRACMKIESSFPLIKEHAPIFLQEDTLEGFELKTNSFPTKELEFELLLPISEVEELILTSDEDEERALATMDEGPKQSFRTSTMSLVGL